MTDRIATVVVGRHDWPDPPSENTVDLPVLRALQQRLGGEMLVIAGTTEPRLSTWREGSLRIVLLPWRSRAAFLRDATRLGTTAGTGREDPVVFVASDVWGGLVGAWLRRRHDVPFLMQVQGDVLQPGPEYGSAVKRLALAAAARIGVRNATVVRCLNPAIQRAVLQHVPHARTEVIGSRVDTERFPFRTPRPGALDDPVIVCVGALSVLKNQQLLIETLASHESLGNASLRLAGSGSEESRLRQLAEDRRVSSRVEFLGAVPYEKIPAILTTADIFAFPSTSEGQPRAVLEALAIGIPVIASDLPAYSGVLEHGTTGLLAQPGDVQAWARALANLAADPDMRQRLSEAGRSLVERRHAFDRQIDRFAAVIQRCSETG